MSLQYLFELIILLFQAGLVLLLGFPGLFKHVPLSLSCTFYVLSFTLEVIQGIHNQCSYIL